MKIWGQVRFWRACKYRRFTGDLQGIGFFAFSVVRRQNGVRQRGGTGAFGGLGPLAPEVRGRRAEGVKAPSRRSEQTTALFCQNPRTLAAAATAAHGLQRRRGATAPSSESNALIAALRRDSARRS
jgi:hypothetical protein